jgi:hypothetical protein
MKKRTLWTLLAMSCAYVAGAWSQSNSVVQLSRVEIDNDQVIVRRNIHPPHSATPMHSHQAGIIVYLTDVRERSTSPDGSSKIVTHRAGEVVWAGARQHKLENLGDNPIEAIEIELKGAHN